MKVGGTVLVQPLLGALVPAEEVDLVLRCVWALAGEPSVTAVGTGHRGPESLV